MITIITFGMTEEEFFSPNPDAGDDPYLAFEEWASANGYNLDDDERRAAAIEAYGGDGAEPPLRVTA